MGITAAQKVRLGIFVIIGMVLLAAFIIAPIGMKLSRRTVTYLAFFENESLQGLEQGANVKFNGVNVGRVQLVDYYPDDFNKMKVVMTVDENFPMRVDMHVRTGLIGITGLKYIEISGGTNDAARLPPGGVLQTREPFFRSAGATLENLVGKVELLLDHLAIVTHPDSLHSIKTILDNVADLAGDAKGVFSGVRHITPKAVGVIDTVQLAINGILGITRDVKEMAETVKIAVDNTNIPGVAAHIDSMVISMRSLADGISLTVMQTREDFSVSMESMREATENANRLTRMLSENPSLIIRGDVRGRDTRR